MANVEYRSVGKSFGSVQVLEKLSLDIADGEFVVLLGSSGCGKSTLLRMTAGLETISSGEIVIDGKVVNGVHPRDRNIAMVFQNYALYPTMKVRENIAFSLEVAGKSKDEIEAQVAEAARVLNLTEYLDRKPSELSGGQRQRVAMGRAMVRNAKVFLFDEPLSNLDAALRVATRIEIAKLHESMDNVTMIYVTHDQVEAMTLADRICVLRDGLVEQVGTPMELYEKPDSIFVAGFIGSPKMNFITGEKAAAFKCTTLGIRGEHMLIKDDGIWEGEVIHTENLGADAYVYLEMGQEEPIVVRLEGAASYQSGAKLRVSPMEDRVHRFDEAGKPIR